MASFARGCRVFLSHIHPSIQSEGGGKLTEFIGYQLVTIMRNEDLQEAGQTSDILYLLHMTHSHLQRLKGTVRILVFDLHRVLDTIEPSQLKGEAQSNGCG